MNESRELELRILHGPQAGSSMPLEEGETYLLGTADNCAVLLAGTQIEAEHAELTVDATGIRVTPIEGKVMSIDRVEVSPGRFVVLGTVLRVGRVKLTVDSVDAPWPSEESLEEPDVVAVAKEEPAQAVAEAEPETLVKVVQPAPRRKARRKARAAGVRAFVPQLLLGGAAMLMVGAALAAWVTSDGTQQHPAPETTAETTPETTPETAAAAGTAAEPKLALRAADALGARFAAAPNAARGDPSAANSALMTPAERAAAVLDFVEAHYVPGEMELRSQPGRDGAVRIVGAAATEAAAAAVIDAARKRFAGAGPIEFSILTRPELAARFEEQLRGAGLASKFKVTQREPKMELEAVLAQPEVRTWENVFAGFTREYGSLLSITAHVRPERGEEIGPIQIETVVGGAFPYVVTAAGRRIAPGGVLEGRTLVAIRDGELVFSDGARMRYAN
ncbi:MAG TPA: type III secretion system inner membrane ring subunit SctD [Ramlibacter sp.]|uniref:type III secretion system inner membrane ring subunit SctD n=1 Tax=Ramlibacter sp. TaxID=1917967 RepID=UPI002C9E9A57|nr:type III secretion system inner membrane ring subunit SctD [Ramlibacter sp.]HVZ45049.1 type III secretion system inner membrane ring subunit SctD [Ramlibacter sp.]